MVRYEVQTCRDNPAQLQAHLDAIAKAGGHVVSVMWQAERKEVVLGEQQPKVVGGFVIVSEYPHHPNSA